MTTRRSFLKGAGAAGIAFCGCGMLDGAHAQEAGRRLPVLVKDKRIKTIDVHSHCLFQDAVNLMGDEARGVFVPVKGAEDQYIAVAERLKQMDAMAIDMEAERFAAFASLALQFPDLAVQQLDDAVKKLGLRGAQIGGSVAGEDFSNPKFHPVWAKAEELGAVLFIHPQSPPELAKRFQGNGWLSNTIGNPLDTTIALSHLIFEGTLDRFPGLKILAAHGGGYLGSYAARSDHACFVAPPGACNPEIKLKKQPTEYLRQLYFDALVFTPEALRHLVAQVGASQVMLGSDHPFVWEQHPVDHIFATTTLSDDEKAAILGGNAARLLGVKV